MLRSDFVKHLAAAALCVWCLGGVSAARAAIWLDQIGELKKVSSGPLAVQDRPLWEEYGLLEAEQAEYTAGARRVTISAFHMKDPTGAYAAFEWSRPAGARPSKLSEAAVETGDGVLFVFSNYLLRFEGWKLAKLEDVGLFLHRLPGLDQSPLPTRYLPARGLVAGSERYVLGPAGLERFSPGVTPAVAAFSMGAEGQIGQYDTAAGRTRLAVFSYPTPQIARQRLDAFMKVPGVMARRAGPLVAVLVAPTDPNQAEKLLAQVKFNAVITENERMPTRRDNVGDLLLNIFILVGIILVIILPAGLLVGILRRLGWGTSGDPMTLLHLEDRSREP
jgi:hypothetical protein